MSVLDKYPENFRPPGADACNLAILEKDLGRAEVVPR
jgi:hypothetical protein